MNYSPFQSALIIRLESDGFIKNSTICSEFVYERAHPNEPMLRTVVNTGIGVYKQGPVSVTTILFTPRRDYTISYLFTVRPLQDHVEFITRIMQAVEVAHDKGCIWYDKKNGTNIASGEILQPKVGGYQKMICPKTPLDGI